MRFCLLITDISRKDVILVFSDEGEFITAYDNGDEATPGKYRDGT